MNRGQESNLAKVSKNTEIITQLQLVTQSKKLSINHLATVNNKIRSESNLAKVNNLNNKD